MSLHLFRAVLLGTLVWFAGLKSVAQDQVLITEFMAANNTTLADEDGDYSDWIEIFNAGTNSVDLDGWYLTDNPTNLRKWRFPATNLNANAYLVVFASGKDRALPGYRLHTSFQLASSGEFLALIRPDGTNVTSYFLPQFRQFNDISFGSSSYSDPVSIIQSLSPARIHVPVNDQLALAWTDLHFDDSNWIRGTNGVGYDGNPNEPGEPVNFITYNHLIHTDVRAVMSNVNASVYIRIPFLVNDPDQIDALTLKMKYDDGFVAYLNGVEIVRRNAPSLAQGGTIADSAYEFSGEQGLHNWFYGYYNYTADSDRTYQPRDFTPFPVDAGPHSANNYWDGSVWDWFQGNPPWTTIGASTVHPNGDNNGNVHWAIRRWVSTVNGTVTARLTLRKENVSCGNGVTGKMFLNGQELFSRTLAANDGTGLTTNLTFGGVNVGDYLDFAVTPLGTDASNADGCDGSVFTVVIDQEASADLTWNSSSTGLHPDDNAQVFEDFDLIGTIPGLQAGTNLLAIHGLNVRSNNVDFLILPELQVRNRFINTERQRYFLLPTPGAPNGFGTQTLGARIADTDHRPRVPADSEDLIVTVRITQTFDPVVSANLTYRVMFNAEVTIPLLDDGQHGDGAAGDGVYGAVIPQTAAAPGQMIRWFITVNDSTGVSSRWPIYEDVQNSPKYLGTMVKVPNMTSPLPVLHWFIENPSVAENNTLGGTKCSLFYLGEFYDNLTVNRHGQSSGGFPKKSFDIDFNPEHHFKWAPEEARVDDINLMTTYPDKAHMRNILAYETYRDAKSPYHFVVPVRVHRNAAYWGDAHLMENGDAGYLKRNGLDPEGAFYKMYNTFTAIANTTIGVNGSAAEKKTRKHEGNADLVALFNGVVGQSGTARTAYIYDNLNIPSIVNYLAARDVTGDRDCCHKNYYFYRDTEGTGEWHVFAWDVDLSFGRNWISSLTYWDDTMTWNNDLFRGNNNGLIAAMYATPEIRQMYLRRVQSLQGQLMQPPGTPPELLRYEKRVDELTALLAPDAAEDLAKWGTWGNGAASSSCCVQTLQQAANLIKDVFLPNRRLFMQNNPYISATGEVPPQPPNPVIGFAEIEVNPASRNQAEEYICVTNINAFPVDISGWKLGGGVRFTFEPGTVLPARGRLYLTPDVRAFRARRGGQGLFVRGDYQGQLSAWGESLTITDTGGRLVASTNFTGSPSLAQQFLRVTELMYNPMKLPSDPPEVNNDEYEYVELKNVSSNATLNLTGVHFTNGIVFSFTGAAITSLAPGERVLIVKNFAAFTNRYGAGHNIAGVYQGNLNNGGETLKLDDIAGEKILEFDYNNQWYPVTDGAGFSLVIVNENAPWDTWGLKESWRSSGQWFGMPGQSKLVPPVIAPVLVNEVLTRSLPPAVDAVELFNPNDQAVNLGGWYLSDDFGAPKKFRIPDDTFIAAGGYLVFTETNFNAVPGAPESFAFRATGDEVYLFSADAQGNLTGYYHGFDFGPAAAGISFGRHLISTGADHFVAQESNTLGTANSPPMPSPVVINEVMFHPPDTNFFSLILDNVQDEFVELHNYSSNAVPLYATGQPTVTWRLRDAVDYEFPPNTSLAPGGFLLVVSFDPQLDPEALAAFRARYSLGPEIPIYGPYEGKLDNSDESVELVRPDRFENGATDYIMTDKVRYRDSYPWPCGTDGDGLSLQRLSGLDYGNEPFNWVAKLPMPGAATIPQTPGVASILAGPVSQFAPTNGSATFAVVVCDADFFSYQWQRDGTDIPGATNTVLVLTNLQTSDSGSYRAVISNQLGGSVATEPAELVVQTPPFIVDHPQGMVLEDSSYARFSVTVTGVPPFAYQWLLNGTPVEGANAAVFELTNVLNSQIGNYSVRVTNSAGSATSAIAKLEMILPAITQQPQSQILPVGATLAVSVGTTGTRPMGYRWRRNSITIVPFEEGSNTLIRPNLQLNDYGLYQVIITNAARPTGIGSQTAYVTVVEPPANRMVLVGAEVTLSARVSGAGTLRYEWKQGDTTLVGQTSTNLTLSNVQLADSGFYTLVVSNATAKIAAEFPVMLTVQTSPTPPEIVEQPTNAIAIPSEGAQFKVLVTGTEPLLYQWWFNETNALEGATNAILDLASVQPENLGAYLVVVSNAAGVVTSQTAFLSYPVPPTITTEPADVAASAGAPAQFSVEVSGTPPFGYQWYFNAGTPLAGAAGDTWSIAAVQPADEGGYSVVVSNSMGAVTSRVASLTISTVVDNDNDGLPDDWEVAHGLNPGLSSDANEDSDGDGMLNWQEFGAGTNPTNAASVFKLEFEPANQGPSQVRLRFNAKANKTYSIQYQDTLGGAAWTNLQQVLSAPNDRAISLTNAPEATGQRYYRIVTPATQ